MKFTWWGGVVGPKILTHVKCRHCGKTFNGKTGRPNTAAIWAYQVVTVVACGILAFLFFKALR